MVSSILIDGAEVAKHSSRTSCWIVLEEHVYDITAFLTTHPGGAAILLKQAGSDATLSFKQHHPAAYINHLPPGSHLGAVNPTTVAHLRAAPTTTDQENKNKNKIPHMTLCITTSDFEHAAKLTLPPKSYTYASTSANTGASLLTNLASWSLIHFRPRILRNVRAMSTTTSILGHSTAYPFYICPLGTLGAIHPEGAESELVAGAVKRGVHVVVSTASTRSCGEIMRGFEKEVGGSETRLFYQYYMPEERDRAVRLLEVVRGEGYKGLWITVDTPVLGKRTGDRVLQAEEALEVDGKGERGQGQGGWEVGGENEFAPRMGGRPVSGQLSPGMEWRDLEWVRREWEGPIVLKGVQCAEDAKLAMEHGVQGIVLSNHGGRQLDSAPSGLMTLLEIRTYCPEVLGKVDVYVDGGLRDGSDVLKALCLGATAVGVGRPFLYALAAYGAQGVERCVDVLAEELEIGMRLLGVSSLDQLRPDMVNATQLLNQMWTPAPRL